MPFTLAKEAVVQVNTLASAVLALSVTFRKDLATKANETSLTLLQISWGFLILSLCMGIFALLAITGQLHKAAQGNVANLYAGGLRTFWIAQIVSFFIGMGLFGVFGIREV